MDQNDDVSGDETRSDELRLAAVMAEAIARWCLSLDHGVPVGAATVSIGAFDCRIEPRPHTPDADTITARVELSTEGWPLASATIQLRDRRILLH